MVDFFAGGESAGVCHIMAQNVLIMQAFNVHASWHTEKKKVFVHAGPTLCVLAYSSRAPSQHMRVSHAGRGHG